MIPLARPDISITEVEEVLSVLRSDVLSLGPRLREFEQRLADLIGVRAAIAVSSGTAGLHLAIRAAGIDIDSDVITTPFSFVASANVMLFERAMPVFVDVDPETLNLSPDAAARVIDDQYTRTPHGLINRLTRRRLVGLLPVDVFGHPVDIEGFRNLADRHHLWLIEDACEALGSELLASSDRQWIPAGRLADLAVYAFYPNKQITTGEGGVVVTNDALLAERCRTERNQGRRPNAKWLEHSVLGFNYRMDEMSAALGVGQLKRFDSLRQRRAQVAQWYDEALEGLDGVHRPTAMPWARPNWFVYVVRLMNGIDRDAVMAFLASRGIQSGAYFPPIHLQSTYRHRLRHADGSFPVCERASQSTLALPFFNRLTRLQVNEVVSVLAEGVRVCGAASPA